MSVLWRVEARGPMAALRPVLAALDAVHEPEALSWSLFEDGSETAGRLDILCETMACAETMAATGGLEAPAISVHVAPLPEEDWVALSLKGLPLVQAGRFAVYGAHAAADLAPGLVGLEGEAGPAFGTGHHATTRGCLEAVDRIAREGFAPASVLDLGAGSGLLAIAAAKLWPRSQIVATDIDAESVAETLVNAEKNGVAPQIVSVEADGYAHPVFDARRFDLIFANILAGPLITLAQQTASHLAPGGRVILAGLLDEQAERVSDAYLAAGLTPAGTQSLDGWSILVFNG
ncbi:MAG: 50S ribosomal protein L11 methyltransferase [Oceanicaulis sp.]|nr:50S ribosomal protein L11 methyltransferase [Oceanicaulis sp.]